MAAGTNTVRSLCLILLCFFWTTGYALKNDDNFADLAEEQRYYQLLSAVRCAVCQNQSLVDSNAPLAEDLRREIYRMLVLEHRSIVDIKHFLVERYGAAILYAPPLQANTWILWFMPILLLLLALTTWLWRTRIREAAPL